MKSLIIGKFELYRSWSDEPFLYSDDSKFLESLISVVYNELSDYNVPIIKNMLVNN